MMDSIARVQMYLRHKAGASLSCHSCTPFSVFVQMDRQENTFMIPDVPVDKAINQVITELQVYASARHIPARVRVIEEYSPAFVAALRSTGFGEVWRQPVMLCTSARQLDAPEIEGLSFAALSAQAAIDDLREAWDTNALGFGETPGVNDAQIEQFRRELKNGRAVIAKVDSVPAGAAMFTAVQRGVAELVGIATLPEFRRRGIAGALTAHAAQAALEHGADLVFLTTDSPDAARVYQRIGFKTAGWLVELSDNPAEWAMSAPA